MNEQLTPEEQLIVQQHAENASIVEKLLGWKRAGDLDVPLWRKPATATRREEEWYTPSFTSWSDAGLILEALDDDGCAWIFSNGPEGDYECRICPHATRDQASYGETGPLAIRAAALRYLRSKS